MLIMKRGKRKITEEIEIPNLERIQTLRDRKNYKCLGILKADPIKQAEIKEKIRVLQKNFLKPYSAGISSKSRLPCKTLGVFLK